MIGTIPERVHSVHVAGKFWLHPDSLATNAARIIREGTSPGTICKGTKGVCQMRVSEAMTRDVYVANPDETIQQAAIAMAGLDAGVLPVGDDDRLVGMITDRDIAIRAVAGGKGPDAKVRDVMTTDVKYCFDDQEIEDVTLNMGEIQVRRMPVVDRQKRLVGILSLGDVAVIDGDGVAGEALSLVSRPGGEHTQTG
jgi:CBS domain-containing protein